ncbi:MAG: ZIP family metal transporter, partial [Planctomycetota bacterium]
TRAIGYANAVASGLMLGASFGLIDEGTAYGGWQTLVGAGAGVLFIVIAERLLGDHEVEIGDLKGKNAKQIILIVGIMTVHSFAEGVAIGVSFGGGATLALAITVALAVHNVPEGLAISAVMRPKGASVGSCAFWSIASSLPQPLMAVPAYLFVEVFRPFLPYGLGFAAGAMVFMVFLELLPEAYEATEQKNGVGLVVSTSLAAMVLFQHYLAV